MGDEEEDYGELDRSTVRLAKAALRFVCSNLSLHLHSSSSVPEELLGGGQPPPPGSSLRAIKSRLLSTISLEALSRDAAAVAIQSGRCGRGALARKIVRRIRRLKALAARGAGRKLRPLQKRFRRRYRSRRRRAAVRLQCFARQRLLRWRVAKREREKVRRREAAFDARIARQVAQDMQIAKEAREAKAAEREKRRLEVMNEKRAS